MRTKKTWILLSITIVLVLIIIVLIAASGFKGFHKGKILTSKFLCNDLCQSYTIYAGNITEKECKEMGENPVYSSGWEVIYVGCGPKQ